MRIHRLAPVLTFALVLVAVTACGSPNDGPGIATANGGTASATPSATASASVDRDVQLRAFAQCMREHGVDLPDPDPDRGFGAGMAGVNLSDPTVQAAFTACQTKLPNGGQPPKLDPKQVEQYRVFAQCMREHGVEVPDPDADGTLRFNAGDLGRIDRSDPTTQGAITACRDKLTGVFGGGTR